MCFSIKIHPNLERLRDLFPSTVDMAAFERMLKQEKYWDEKGRVFPKSYAPVCLMMKGGPTWVPLRYQLLPSFSPSEKYLRRDPKSGRESEIKNTYNARLDSLTKREAWKPLLGKRQGIVAFSSFYEWTQKENQSTQLVEFSPEGHQTLYSPVLWDHWRSADGRHIINSFALITDDPLPEVLSWGHDRSPVFLRPEGILPWMQSTQDPVRFLKNRAFRYHPRLAGKALSHDHDKV